MLSGNKEAKVTRASLFQFDTTIELSGHPGLGLLSRILNIHSLSDMIISRLKTLPNARQEQRGGNKKWQEFPCSDLELTSGCPLPRSGSSF